MPPLQKVKFDGVSKHYWAFKLNAFNLVANENNDLIDVEQFTYLRIFLTGHAFRLLALTINNFRVALELSERRYGSKHVIISSHMDSLYKLPVIRSSQEVKGIREFHNKKEINFRWLEAIWVNSDCNDCLLVPINKDKVCNELNVHFSCQFDASVDAWKTNDLMKDLR